MQANANQVADKCKLMQIVLSIYRYQRWHINDHSI